MDPRDAESETQMRIERRLKEGPRRDDERAHQQEPVRAPGPSGRASGAVKNVDRDEKEAPR